MIYNETKLYCPNCGKQTVYVEDNDGDYYEGPTHLCTSCDRDFTLPSNHSANEYASSKRDLELLKREIQKEGKK